MRGNVKTTAEKKDETASILYELFYMNYCIEPQLLKKTKKKDKTKKDNTKDKTNHFGFVPITDRGFMLFPNQNQSVSKFHVCLKMCSTFFACSTFLADKRQLSKTKPVIPGNA
jgi:hypothetical protein